jgi:hypothetical protein
VLLLGNGFVLGVDEKVNETVVIERSSDGVKESGLRA